MKNTINEDRKWRVLSSEYLFRRPWLTARKDVVKLPDGRVNPEYYVLEYPDWVNVIALTADGQMILELPPETKDQEIIIEFFTKNGLSVSEVNK